MTKKRVVGLLGESREWKGGSEIFGKNLLKGCQRKRLKRWRTEKFGEFASRRFGERTRVCASKKKREGGKSHSLNFCPKYLGGIKGPAYAVHKRAHRFARTKSLGSSSRDLTGSFC